jgi:hypothetical protein
VALCAPRRPLLFLHSYPETVVSSTVKALVARTKYENGRK